MKYANLITYKADLKNIGEDVQFMAIEHLYQYMGIPYEDVVRITYKEMFSYDGVEYLVLPVNVPFWGIYGTLSPKIIPVYLGISTLGGDSIVDSMRFREFQPIGCRDQRTYEECQKRGIQAYINGCMSLTLPRSGIKGDNVYIVDVCEELLECIPKEIKENAIYKTHVFYNKDIPETESKKIYQEYREKARLIISSRLHCISPCVAFGIPVIYAPRNISTRTNWLKKLIPIYDKSKFGEIDWNPKAVEIESLKKIMLENAANRIKETWNKYYPICGLTEFFEDEEQEKLIPEDLIVAAEYIQKNWKRDREYKYLIWGITQTAENLYTFIKESGYVAELVGVIDVYKKVKFLGFEAEGIEKMDEIGEDVVVFLTAESAHKYALEVFKEKNIHNYVLCWLNPNYKMQED